MNKMGKVDGVLFFLRANEKKNKKIKKNMASAMSTWIMPEKTGETDRKEANTIGRALFSMIPSRP